MDKRSQLIKSQHENNTTSILYYLKQDKKNSKDDENSRIFYSFLLTPLVLLAKDIEKDEDEIEEKVKPEQRK